MPIKEENLIPYPGVLRPGQRLVKVGNSFVPVGIGGSIDSGGGGDVEASGEYYVCVATDDVAKTWVGRKLERNADGWYEPVTEVTNDIPYLGFVPIPGNYYDRTTLVKIEQIYSPSSYLDGIVFSASMQDKTALYNGNTVLLDGVNLVAAPGYTDGTKVLANGFEFAVNGEKDFTDGNSATALSIYLSSVGDGQQFVKALTADGWESISVSQQGGFFRLIMYITSGYTHTVNFDAGGWYHIVITNKGNEFAKWYINGVEVLADSDTQGFDVSEYLRSATRITSSLSGSYLKDLQIYNRTLEAAEVEDLYEQSKLPVV